MPKYKMAHLHLVTPNPVGTVELFKTMFGATVFKEVNLPEPDGRHVFELDIEGLHLVVSDQRRKPLAPIPLAGGIDHISLETDDIEKTVKELKAAGAQVLEDIHSPSTSPWIKTAAFLVDSKYQIHVAYVGPH
jgi:catechol 2,3-dioxygenase-like lactoylglutathione lyase family enzyme